jgi:DNA polymerase-3 subunit beta
MRVSVRQEDISDGVRIAASLIPTIPENHRNIKRKNICGTGAIWLMADASDLRIMSLDSTGAVFIGRYPASVAEPGVTGMPGRAFTSLARQLPPGEIEITAFEDKVHLRQGEGEYQFQSAGLLPPVSVFPDVNAVIVPAGLLRNSIDRVSFCASDNGDALHPVDCLSLKGVGNRRVEACCLDGHQMALCSFEHPGLACLLGESGLRVHRDNIRAVEKWLMRDSVECNITETNFCLRDAGESFFVPRVSSVYPDYSTFLSKVASTDNACRAVMNRRACMDILGQFGVFASDIVPLAVQMVFSDPEVRMKTIGLSTGAASAKMPVDFRGNVRSIVFPAAQLHNILSHFSSDTVELTFTGKESPCGVRGQSDSDYVVLIMPMLVYEN